MNVGFQSLGSAWLFLLVAPLVVLYFLRLKRPHVRVPSLTLWRQVLADRRVNSPFQKFKRNLLLLLQLLLLSLLTPQGSDGYRRQDKSSDAAVRLDLCQLERLTSDFFERMANLESAPLENQIGPGHPEHLAETQAKRQRDHE